jgi:hypothetical protein
MGSVPRGVLNEVTEAAAEADRVVWIAAQNGLAQSVSIVCDRLAEVVARILRRLAATSNLYLATRPEKWNGKYPRLVTRVMGAQQCTQPADPGLGFFSSMPL